MHYSEAMNIFGTNRTTEIRLVSNQVQGLLDRTRSNGAEHSSFWTFHPARLLVSRVSKRSGSQKESCNYLPLSYYLTLEIPHVFLRIRIARMPIDNCTCSVCINVSRRRNFSIGLNSFVEQKSMLLSPWQAGMYFAEEMVLL